MSDDLVKRLDSLWAMLEEEGFYTKANTVVLAKNRIEELEAQLAEYKMVARTVDDEWCASEDEVDRLKAQLATREWQPIETAPRDGTGFLGFVKQDWIEVFAFLGGQLCWLSDGDGPKFERDYPTHWMPLPEPPKSAEKGTGNE